MNIEDLTQQLSLQSPAPNLQVVVVDALNYLSILVPFEEEEFADKPPLELFREARERVRELTEAAARPDTKFIWVFDNGQATEETNQKWIRRRFKEVTESRRNMPAAADLVLHALLLDTGAPVLYPADMDGDDAVALLAWKLDGWVLSRDRDFLRYEPELPHSSVYKAFGILPDGRLTLEQQYPQLPPGVEPRRLLDLEALLPQALDDASLFEAWGMHQPDMYRYALRGEMRRGNPDSHTAECGNLYAYAFPLLASIYSNMNVPSTGVVFRCPQAESKADGTFRPMLDETTILPSDDVARFLVARDAELVRDYLRQSATLPEDPDDYKERLHSICMVAAEVACTMNFAILTQSGSPIPYTSAIGPATTVYGMYQNLCEEEDELRATHNPTNATWDNVFTHCQFRGGCQSTPPGWCFASRIQYAQKQNKKPICQGCIDFLTGQHTN